MGQIPRSPRNLEVCLLNASTESLAGYDDSHFSMSNRGEVNMIDSKTYSVFFASEGAVVGTTLR